MGLRVYKHQIISSGDNASDLKEVSTDNPSLFKFVKNTGLCSSATKKDYRISDDLLYQIGAKSKEWHYTILTKEDKLASLAHTKEKYKATEEQALSLLEEGKIYYSISYCDKYISSNVMRNIVAEAQKLGLIGEILLEGEQEPWFCSQNCFILVECKIKPKDLDVLLYKENVTYLQNGGEKDNFDLEQSRYIFNDVELERIKCMFKEDQPIQTFTLGKNEYLYISV